MVISKGVGLIPTLMITRVKELERSIVRSVLEAAVWVL